MPTVDPLSQEIARIGRDLYERRIRPQVETEANIGRLVSIDIDAGDYEVGDNLLETVERLQARRPDAEVWTERIGYNAVHAVGGSLRRLDR